MVRETSLSAADFIYPLFVHEGVGVEPIGAMPGAHGGGSGDALGGGGGGGEVGGDGGAYAPMMP